MRADGERRWVWAVAAQAEGSGAIALVRTANNASDLPLATVDSPFLLL